MPEKYWNYNGIPVKKTGTDEEIAEFEVDQAHLAGHEVTVEEYDALLAQFKSENPDSQTNEEN